MDTSNFKEVFESPKVKTLTAQVAELEAEVMRLRNALRETTVALEHRWEVVANRAAPIMESVIDAAHTKGIEALFTQFNPQALTELIEKVEKMTIECYVPMIKQCDSPAEEAIAKIEGVLKHA